MPGTKPDWQAGQGLGAERADRIELVYLPAYSPEANPDEYLNRDLKTNLRQGPVARQPIN
ncbi:transposase [Thauera sinica]|uniref:Transposase n=1 Tax=Thauera sinica TaxID=2665146 RepID=A0ABW1ANP2_9RHOO